MAKKKDADEEYLLHHKSHIKLGASDLFIRGFGYVFVTLFAALCVFPFLLIIGTSFSLESDVTKYGITAWPRHFSVQAYQLLFRFPQTMINSYLLTIILTATGTVCGLFIISMTGYALQRKDFPFRNGISFMIYFTTLFSGGLVATYLLYTKILNLRDNYLAIWFPNLMSAWLIILMKNFVRSIPFEITESGKIDGAGDFRIFRSLILPMLKPGLATIGLFPALGYWNEWYNASLYLSSRVDVKPLQYQLYNVINTANALKNSVAGANVTVTDLPTMTLKMATAVVATGPIIFVYPFVQKYFISGITVGAVKG